MRIRILLRSQLKGEKTFPYLIMTAAKKDNKPVSVIKDAFRKNAFRKIEKSLYSCHPYNNGVGSTAAQIRHI